MPDEGIIALLIGFGLLVVLPIISVLTHHQRKMAELMRKQPMAQPRVSDPEVAALRQEVADLSGKLNQVILALDDQRVRATPPPAPEPLRMPPDEIARIEHRLS